MRATLQDIANRVGAARSTVSTVLNKSRSTIRVSDSKREQIERVAKEMGYRPSFSGRSLRKGKTLSIGVVLGEFTNPYFAELASIIAEETERNGYHLVLSLTDTHADRSLECLDMLVERGVDGVIMWTWAGHPETAQYAFVRKHRFPLVTLRHSVEGVAGVTTDVRVGAGQAVTHLKARGHRRVGFMGMSEDPREQREQKTAAFLEATAAHGLEPVALPGVSLAGDRVAESMAHLVARPGFPRAVIARSEPYAMHLIGALARAGRAVPGDVDVICYGGSQMGALFRPALTTISHCLRRVGSTAVGLVLEMLAHPEAPRRHVVLPTELVVRESA